MFLNLRVVGLVFKEITFIDLNIYRKNLDKQEKVEKTVQGDQLILNYSSLEIMPTRR